jgi:hypothetical protein
MNIKDISTETLRIISPLLIEMEEGQHKLNKTEFIEACLRLLQTLTIGEKHIVLFNYKKE